MSKQRPYKPRFKTRIRSLQVGDICEAIVPVNGMRTDVLGMAFVIRDAVEGEYVGECISSLLRARAGDKVCLLLGLDRGSRVTLMFGEMGADVLVRAKK